MSRLIALLFVSATVGCAPLTFSEPGAIDFSRYRVALVTGDGAEYLAQELRQTSGFAAVTTNRATPVDLELHVSVFVEQQSDCACDCNCSDSCSCDYDYEGTASYEAKTPGGASIDRGTESDVSETPDEAFEDALDEVALHYIRAYRL